MCRVWHAWAHARGADRYASRGAARAGPFVVGVPPFFRYGGTSLCRLVNPAVRGAASDLHSGADGGCFREAMADLAAITASLIKVWTAPPRHLLRPRATPCP